MAVSIRHQARVWARARTGWHMMACVCYPCPRARAVRACGATYREVGLVGAHVQQLGELLARGVLIGRGPALARCLEPLVQCERAPEDVVLDLARLGLRCPLALQEANEPVRLAARALAHPLFQASADAPQLLGSRATQHEGSALGKLGQHCLVVVHPLGRRRTRALKPRSVAHDDGAQLLRLAHRVPHRRSHLLRVVLLGERALVVQHQQEAFELIQRILRPQVFLSRLHLVCLRLTRL